MLGVETDDGGVRPAGTGEEEWVDLEAVGEVEDCADVEDLADVEGGGGALEGEIEGAEGGIDGVGAGAGVVVMGLGEGVVEIEAGAAADLIGGGEEQAVVVGVGVGFLCEQAADSGVGPGGKDGKTGGGDGGVGEVEVQAALQAPGALWR